MLGELEMAAAAKPSDARVWNAALTELRLGRVTDNDVGASATTGGARPVAVAVVTAYCHEDLAALWRCHQSVLTQTYPCRHVMVSDGFPRQEVDTWNVEHIRLERAHADYGDTPRVVGGERALALGCDAIAYVDADNSFRPHHVESLVRRRQVTGADVVFSGRTLHFPTGQMLPVLKRVDGRTHIDTNCLFLAGDARAMASLWHAYPRPLARIGDRLVVRMLRARGFAFACTGALTVRYTVNYAAQYAALNVPVSPDARADFDVGPLAAYCRDLSETQWRELDATLGFPATAFLREYLKDRGIALDQSG